MKKILFAAFAGLVCCVTSCNTATTATDNMGDSTQQKNLAAFDVISKAFNSGNASSIDSVVADDFIDHTDRGDVKGRDSLKAMITMMHNTMKDMKTEIINTAASGDYVYGWMRYKGTSDGSMGMPRGPYDMSAVELAKFKDGKAVEHWAFMQVADMMKMMGPQPAMDNMGKMDKMDTTKMSK